jgi:hypothetical protein
MSIADKLKTIAENEQKVYDAGYEKGKVENEGKDNSALPIEVLTESEMNALLTSGEVGGVYKYMGETTDTYENGALYVLEEETENLISFTIDGTSYQAEKGMTWAEWCDSSYNTGGFSYLGDRRVLASNGWYLMADGSLVYSSYVIVSDYAYMTADPLG